MQMTLRWFGTGHDAVTLDKIRQVPGVKGVITTLYDTKPGEANSIHNSLITDHRSPITEITEITDNSFFIEKISYLCIFKNNT